jgi:hypothetical protein
MERSNRSLFGAGVLIPDGRHRNMAPWEGSLGPGARYPG